MSHEPYSSARAGAPWPPPAPSPGPSRLLPILSVVLGLLGLATGTAAWFRAAPSHSAAPAYTEQQVADAKKAVCEAYAKGMRSIRTVGTVKVDPTNWFPTAINTRLAGFASATYMIDALGSNPAAPNGLQDMVRQVASAYRDIALSQLADGTPQDYQSDNDTVQELVPKIDLTCQ